MAEVLPDVEIRGELGEHHTLLSIEKARRVLGPGAVTVIEQSQTYK